MIIIALILITAFSLVILAAFPRPRREVMTAAERKSLAVALKFENDTRSRVGGWWEEVFTQETRQE